MRLSDMSLACLREADRVLCAVSGGADSMCLLHQLFTLSATLRYELIAIHFHHGLRAAADRDAQFVQAWCEARQIPFYCERGDAAACAAERGLGIEEAARKLRYDFFARMASRLEADWVATAHNADDNLETVLMRLIRGSGLRGLCGIPEKRGIYLRPLLHVTRAEIEAYLACNGIAHMEDESNADPAYTRNRIRLEILPRLRALNPNVANTVLQSGRSLAEDADYLRQTAQEALDQSCRRTAQAVDISIAVLTGAHRAVASRMLRLMAEMLGCGLSRQQTEALLDMASAPSPSATLSLSGPLGAQRQYDRLRLTTETAAYAFSPVQLTEGKTVRLEAAGLSLYCGHAANLKKIHNSFFLFCFKKSAICGNMTVRPRKSGDQIRLLDRNCSKSLKKLFVEEKIPRLKRTQIPVIADAAGVLAVIGIPPGGVCVDSRVACRPGEDRLWIAVWED